MIYHDRYVTELLALMKVAAVRMGKNMVEQINVCI